MKTVLSFDVGIVNLAYCILKKVDSETNDKFEILKWDIINIDDNKLTCSYINKQSKTDKEKNKNNLCNQNAKYILNTDHYCTVHYKSFMKNFDKTNKPELKIKTLDVPVKCSEKCKSIADKSFDDNIVCDKHLEKKKKDYLAENTPRKLKNQNSNYKSINNLSSMLYAKLDKLQSDFLSVDEVLIENQPSLLNPTMKTISALLYSYFTIRGIIDKSITNSNITTVHFISPQNKLKINKTITDKTLNNSSVDTKRKEYILTKDLGKKYCRKLIETEKKYLDILDSFKKSDDLCDSFLQGFYYLFFKDGNFSETFQKLLDQIAEICDKEQINKEKKKFIKKLEMSIK